MFAALAIYIRAAIVSHSAVRAQGKTGEQLKQLQQSAWKLFRRQQAARVQACVFYVWLRAAVQSRKLRWAQAVWTRRMLDMYFSEWCLLAANLRYVWVCCVCLAE